jgi:hypothetical protein
MPPSMKAALEPWGSKTNLFHQGFAKETDDPVVVAATMAKPGVVLKRAVGSSGSFTRHSELPKHLTSGEVSRTPGEHARNSPPQQIDKRDDKAAREAAAAYAREQKRRDRERRRQEAERKRRQQKTCGCCLSKIAGRS